VPDVAETSLRYFGPSVPFDDVAVRKLWLGDPAATRDLLEAELHILRSLDPFDHAALESALRGLAEERGVGFGKIIGPLRVALLGVPDSPGIFDVLLLLGRERAVTRVETALSELERRAAG